MPFSLNTLHEFVDWFVPAELAADREMRKQARLFLISHLLGPFLGNVVPIALYVLDPDPGFEVTVLAISITSFWIFPPLLRVWGRYYNLIALVSIQNLIFCILWSCYFYGGVTSPTLPWVLTIPLLSFFYLGSSPTLRLVVLAMFVVNFGVFCALYFSGHVPEVGIPFSALQGLGLLSTAAASAYVIMMALFYARAVASQSEMAVEMRGHLKTAAELRRAATEAERASVAKADFLAKMSHELRTPLNAVIGYSQMLLEEAEDESDSESVADLERIHIAGQHLLRLVNDILDLSKIEAGKMEVFNEEIQFVGLVEEAVATVRPIAARNGNQISLEIRPRDRHHRVRCQQGSPRPVPGSGECGQIHARRQHPCPMRPARNGTWRPVAGIGSRHRRRHRARPDSGPLRAIRRGRRLQFEQIWWYRPGPRPQPEALPLDGRRCDRRKHLEYRKLLHHHAPGCAAPWDRGLGLRCVCRRRGRPIRSSGRPSRGCCCASREIHPVWPSEGSSRRQCIKY